MVGKADGIITDTPSLPLTQRYADCTPLIVYDPRRHAVGLGHAGWRGTLAGMAAALVQAMTASFGSNPGDLVAVVGPAIGLLLRSRPGGSRCRERGFPCGKYAADQAGANGATQQHFDLWAANRWQLQQAGVGLIEVAGI